MCDAWMAVRMAYMHVWMGACGCAARAWGLCARAACVDGSLWVCCTGKGSLCACCVCGWEPVGALHGHMIFVCVDGSLWVCCTGKGPLRACCMCGCAQLHGGLCVRAACVDGSLWVCCTGKVSLCACCMCGWEPVGMLHGQRVSACALHVWMGTCGCAARAEGLCVRAACVDGACGCAARAKGLCVRAACVDGNLWVCSTGKGSLRACCMCGWEPVGVHGQRVSVCVLPTICFFHRYR